MDPFGYNAPNENPSGLGNFTCNLRFPGQYFDRETNLHYNYFRDYDPLTGRYAQSDPIGLGGGANTYLYVLADPLRRIDPKGLATVPGPGGVPVPVPILPPAGPAQGKKPGEVVFPPGYDPNPKTPQGVPIITPLEPLPPQAPKPPGSGCQGVFESCVKGLVQGCPIPALRPPLAAVCFAVWLACEATQ